MANVNYLKNVILNLKLYGKGFHVNGLLAPVADIGANSLIAKTNGYTNILFDNT